ncbi:hypothetical protein EES41_06350 [Streptomyces sp. ADI95-16]|nr:hypothetical protein EES41_06350 [Streptomyces sp. ADI95-16]
MSCNIVLSTVADTADLLGQIAPSTFKHLQRRLLWLGPHPPVWTTLPVPPLGAWRVPANRVRTGPVTASSRT